MDEMSLIYNVNLCRICQIPDNLDLINTSTTTNNGETYLVLLKFIFSDILFIEDHQISVACKICLEKIENIAEFKKICIDTNTRRADHNLEDIKVEVAEVKLESNDQKTNTDVEKSLPETDTSSAILRKKRKGDQRENTLKRNKLKVSKIVKSKIKKKRRLKAKTRKQSLFTDIADTDDDVAINGNDDVEEEDIEHEDMDCSKTNSSSSKEIMCRICKQKLPSFKFLKNHTKKLHPKHLFYHCDECEETFPMKDYWERHEFKHTGVKKYVCTHCGAKYITMSDLSHHMDNHKDSAKYACAICPGKVFKTSNCLTKHKMLVHRDRKDYKHLCTECGMRFGMLSGLRVHLLRHANIRTFSCHLCDKMFCTKQELERHAVTHSNVRHFKCDVCPAEYKLKSVLLKHKSKIHAIGNYKYAVPKFSCTYCSKTVLSKCKLQRHIRTHTGEKPFKCRLCPTKFSCKSYVKGHVKGKHNIDVEASEFDAKSYYDVCETEDAIPEDETSGLILNNEKKLKISI